MIQIQTKEDVWTDKTKDSKDNKEEWAYLSETQKEILMKLYVAKIIWETVPSQQLKIWYLSKHF
jgi:hypothetical protein